MEDASLYGVCETERVCNEEKEKKVEQLKKTKTKKKPSKVFFGLGFE